VIDLHIAEPGRLDLHDVTVDQRSNCMLQSLLSAIFSALR